MSNNNRRTSTIADLEHEQASTRKPARVVRSIGIALLVLLIALAAIGYTGARSDTRSAVSNGYKLSVRYPRITRPGLAINWQIMVEADEPFDGPVTLRSDAAYFFLFDENALEPEPDVVRNNGQYVDWVYKSPPGRSLVVTLDARSEPGVQSGRTGKTVLIIDGKEVAKMSYKTRVAP